MAPTPAADGPFLDEPASNGHPFSDDPALNEPSLVPFTSETRPGRPHLDYVDARLVSSGDIRASGVPHVVRLDDVLVPAAGRALTPRPAELVPSAPFAELRV